MRKFPLVSPLIALGGNQSHGSDAAAGSGCSLCAYGTWSALFHWNRTLPVLMLISCTMPLMTVWSAGPPIEVRLAVAVVYEMTSAVFHGVMRNSWPWAGGPWP